MDAVAQALLARGYGLETVTDEGIRPFLPWVFELPVAVQLRATGHVEDCRVEVAAYVSRGSGGAPSEHLVAIVWSPTIVHEAVVFRRATPWAKVSLAKVLFDAIAWLPPFSLLKLGDAPRVDTKTATGHAGFDAHFRVAADDPSEGVRAVPPALCEALVTLRFQGTIELREGAMVYTVDGARWTADGVDRLLAPLAQLVPAMRRRGYHPMR